MRRSAARSGALPLGLASALLCAGCQRDAPRPDAPTPAGAATAGSGEASPRDRERPPAPRGATPPAATAASPELDWRLAPEGDVAPLVQEELARAETEGQELVVYVGASWCEPCNRFHDAATAGQLDGMLPRLRLLQFDLDHDAERLKQAGYAPKLIPMFALPLPDGRASPDRAEGGVKGEGAVGVILPRLRALLEKRTARPAATF